MTRMTIVYHINLCETLNCSTKSDTDSLGQLELEMSVETVVVRNFTPWKPSHLAPLEQKMNKIFNIFGWNALAFPSAYDVFCAPFLIWFELRNPLESIIIIDHLTPIMTVKY